MTLTNALLYPRLLLKAQGMRSKPEPAVRVEDGLLRVAPMNAPPNALPGARFECLFELDQGSTSRAYLAIDREARGESPLVALHLADAALGNEEHLLDALRERASLSRQLSHPNIVRTIDVVTDGHLCFWLTEFVPGQTLARVLDSKPDQALPLNQQLLILREVLLGLEYAHQFVDASNAPRPMIHRNLCPARVILDYSGNVKICDYALGASGDITFGRFDGGAVCLPYFAPERCIGNPVDPRCDVYAVGGMLWEALSGRPRQFGSNLQEALQLRMQDREPRIEQVYPNVPHELAEVTGRALAWQPDHRYQTAREFRVELDAYLLANDIAFDLTPLGQFLQLRFGDEQAALKQLLIDRTSLARVKDTTALAQTKIGAAIAPIEALKGTRMGQSGGQWRRWGAQLAAGALGGALTLSVLATWLVPKSRERSADRPSAPTVLPTVLPTVPPHGSQAGPHADDGAGSAGSASDGEPVRATFSLRPAADRGAVAKPSAPDEQSGSALAPTSAAENDEHSAESTVPSKARRSQPGQRWRAGRTVGKNRSPEDAALRAATARVEHQPPPDAPPPDDAQAASSVSPPADASAGIDLRTQKRRAPRPIDTTDPYSP